MAQRRALVIAAGRVQELPSADSLQGVAQWSFGTGDPSDAAGAQGDYYVGSDNKLWSKGATTWTFTGVQYGSSAAVPEKTVPVDADILSLGDSANGLQMRKLTWGNMRAALPFREKLTAARTYYVRTDGNDSNTGLANTSAGAFLTIQKAVDTVGALDSAIYGITISVAAGSYSPFTTKDPIGAGVVAIVGAGVATTGVSTSSGPCITVPGGSTKYIISGFKLSSSDTGPAGDAISVGIGGSVLAYALEFGACGNFHVNCSGAITLQSYSISGGARIHWYASNAAKIICAGFTITLSGTPAFSIAFAYGDCLSLLRVNANTFSGAATGQRYQVSINAAIYVNGAGASYLPGSTAGAASSGGQYA
ncbi:hypothetical protein [Acidovorax phage AP1]|nr:hypothetical protein [Acidovorax phage AP1]